MRVSLPPSLSHSLFLSLHFSMDAGYAWQVFSTSLFFSPVISPLPPSNSLSLSFIPLFPPLARRILRAGEGDLVKSLRCAE